MPFYTYLKHSDSDDAATCNKKLRVATNLRLLKRKLKEHFVASGSACDPRRAVRIATWNLREFGGAKYKGRSFEEIYYIAEIISHFDLVALQEIRADLREFSELTRVLGPDWDYVATDVTDGSAGNGERMIFLFNVRRVQFRNIAGELTLKEGGKIRAAFGERIKLEDGLQVRLPPNANLLSGTYDARVKKDDNTHKLDLDLEIPLPEGCVLDIPDGASIAITKGTQVQKPAKGKAKVSVPRKIKGKKYRLRFPNDSFDDSLRQFARTPYLLSFQAGWLKLNLCTVHIYYGDASDEKKLGQRRSEIEQLTEAMANKAKGEFKYDDKAFLGVLGDFNIIGKGHPTMGALESNGFLIPDQLKQVPGSNVARDKAYDQIAFWKPSRVSGYVRLDILAANVFDFFEHVMTVNDETTYRAEAPGNGLKTSSKFKTWRTYKMSDHLPMWVELQTDFSQEYLEEIESAH